MSTKEEFNQKMDAEVAHAQAELERYTALGMGFTAEPPVACLHGNDEGDYPYGEGLSGRPPRKK